MLKSIFTAQLPCLIQEGKADVNQATTDNGASPLFIAYFNGHVEVVKYLIDEGADPFIRGSHVKPQEFD